MSDREIRDQLMTLLLAGHETTATGLAWTLDLLTRNPDVLARARAGGDEYLRAVVAESLRLRPGRAARRPPARDRPRGRRRLDPGGHRRHARDLARPHPPRRPSRTRTRSGPERFLERPPSTYTWIPYGGGVRRCLGAAVRGDGDAGRAGRDPAPLRPARRPAAAPSASPGATSRSRRATAPASSRARRADTHLTRPDARCSRIRVSAREHSASCCRSGHGCRRRRSRRACSPPRPLRPPARALPRCRSRCARTASTTAPSTGSPGPAPPPACAASRPRAGSSPTASSARGRAARSARRAAIPIGSRPLRAGHRGWDVAALQFALETHGFPCGSVDGGFGARTDRRGPAPAGLRRPAAPTASPARPRSPRSRARPVRAPPLRRPIAAPVGDRYGPRGASFHAGLDFPAPTGTAITAAAAGRVAFAGYDDGWGLTIVLDHGNGRPHPLRPPLRRHGLPRRLRRRRHPGRPRRLHRLRHRPAPALRGHRPRRQRRPALS